MYPAALRLALSHMPLCTVSSTLCSAESKSFNSHVFRWFDTCTLTNARVPVLLVSLPAVKEAFSGPLARRAVNDRLFAISGASSSSGFEAAATALHVAAAGGHLRVVQWLLLQGADASARDAMHNLPVQVAKGSAVKACIRDAMAGVLPSLRRGGGRSENVDPVGSSRVAKQIRRLDDKVEDALAVIRRQSDDVAALKGDVRRLSREGARSAMQPSHVEFAVPMPAPPLPGAPGAYGKSAPPTTLQEVIALAMYNDSRILQLESVLSRNTVLLWVVTVLAVVGVVLGAVALAV